jgi:Secretion system C-terminal sorting domain
MKQVIVGIKELLRRKFVLPVIAAFAFLFLGWGQVGHYIINYNTILSAYPELEFFNTWADSLAAHASDADYRKSWDPNEAPKHYIDIDNYPEFISTGTIPQDFDSVVAAHGYSFVLEQGFLPWAILNTADSLETAFENNDMHTAMLIAADLGHYIADSHQPLHITKNYDGQNTNQNGVHSRYETHMIGDYQSEIVYNGDSLQYIDNLPDFVFNMIYDNYQYVDSVLYADSVAQAYAGNHNSTTYYSKFWELAKNFTIGLFQKASYRIACVIYTEWINAGGSPTGISEQKNISLKDFQLYQNYPNPFNPSTVISYHLPANNFVSLKVYDIIGNEVATLVSESKPAGEYAVRFNGTNLPSGVYIYRLNSGNFSASKKLLLMK